VVHQSDLRLLYLDSFVRKADIKDCEYQFMDKCMKCGVGLILYQNGCVKECPKGLYLDKVEMGCK